MPFKCTVNGLRERALASFLTACLFGTTGSIAVISISGCSLIANDALAKQISALAEDNKNAEIISLCDEKLKSDPNNVSLIASRGVALLRMGKNDEAMIALQKAIALDGKSAWHYREIGNVYAAQRHYNEAFANYEKSLLLEKDDYGKAKTYMYRANVHQTMQEFPKVVADTTAVLKLAPTGKLAGNAYLTRADACCELYDYARGLADINKAAEFGASEPSTTFSRLRLDFGLGEYDKARNDVVRLLSFDKNNWYPLEFIAIIDQTSGDGPNAVKVADKLIAHAPKSAAGYSSKAACLFCQGNFKEARAVIDKGLAIEPKSARALLVGAMVAAKDKDESKFSALQGRAEAVLPNYTHAAANRALCLLFLGKYQDAIALCDTIVKKRTEEIKLAGADVAVKLPFIYYLRSEANRRLKNNAQAEIDMRTAFTQGFRKRTMVEQYLKQL